MKIELFLLLLISNLTLGYSQIHTVPKLTNQKPAAGFRVAITPHEYERTEIYYSLYLPENYKKGNKYPIIVEYTGNKYDPSGSTGKVKDASLGYSIAKRIGAIWVVFPYIENDRSVTTWWGNEEETIEFALINIKKICEDYGGNPAEIFICGFSRGAIGVNYLGLHNDEIADVWLGFFSHDHYDGVQEWKDWGVPLTKYRGEAIERFSRIKGRNCLISQEVKEDERSSETNRYIEKHGLDTLANVEYNLFSMSSVIPDIPTESVPSRHTDKWLLYESIYADSVYEWFLRTIDSKPNTLSISGVVIDTKGLPVKGAVIASGRIHYTTTNRTGAYTLEGLISGNRTITILHQESGSVLNSKEIYLEADIKGLDYKIQRN